MPIEKQSFYLFILLIFIWFSACSTTEEFAGYSYDPEGVTETYDREIAPQQKRTIGFMADGVWITNEFNGARANDVYRIDEYHYKIVIEPEISPINNSAWYGFKVWGDEPADIKIELEYPEGRQRYIPTISTDEGEIWYKADSTYFQRDRETGNGILTIEVDEQPIWVSAQEVFTTDHLQNWIDKFADLPYLQTNTVGYSHEERPIHLLKISEHSDLAKKGVVIVYNRQHPPEVPGYMAGMGFLEALLSDSELARKFRTYFDVWAFPMINPDGVDNGHWRTNAAGVDLNRDWEHFRQPETAAIRQALLPLKEREDRKVFYGVDFHSTGQNKFYPINRDIETFPENFTFSWAEEIDRKMPELNLRVEPFDIVSPIAKNWTYKTFGADAVTFEVWDELPRDKLKKFGAISTEIFMELMIEEFEKFYAGEMARFSIETQ